MATPDPSRTGIRSSTQWLMAALGAVTAALVARIPTIASQELTTLGILLEFGSLITALVAVVLVVVKASRVLSISPIAPADLVRKENQAKEQQLKPPSGTAKSIATRLSEVGPYGSLHEARQHSLALMRIVNKRAELTQTSSEGTGTLLEITKDLDDRINRLVFWEHADREAETYRKLLKGLAWMLPLFLLAAILNMAVPAIPGTQLRLEDQRITHPQAVEVWSADPSKSRLDPTCPRILAGTAIGGSISQPHVVTQASGTCPSYDIARPADLGISTRLLPA